MQNRTHICNKCGWGFPNPHPSAKQRRAHKKVCQGFKLHESQENVQEPNEGIGNEEMRSDLIVRQVSNRSEEEEYSDAVADFAESDVKASNGTKIQPSDYPTHNSSSRTPKAPERVLFQLESDTQTQHHSSSSTMETPAGSIPDKKAESSTLYPNKEANGSSCKVSLNTNTVTLPMDRNVEEIETDALGQNMSPNERPVLTCSNSIEPEASENIVSDSGYTVVLPEDAVVHETIDAVNGKDDPIVFPEGSISDKKAESSTLDPNKEANGSSCKVSLNTNTVTLPMDRNVEEIDTDALGQNMSRNERPVLTCSNSIEPEASENIVSDSGDTVVLPEDAVVHETIDAVNGKDDPIVFLEGSISDKKAELSTLDPNKEANGSSCKVSLNTNTVTLPMDRNVEEIETDALGHNMSRNERPVLTCSNSIEPEASENIVSDSGDTAVLPEDAVVHETIDAVNGKDDPIVFPEDAAVHEAINAVSGDDDTADFSEDAVSGEDDIVVFPEDAVSEEDDIIVFPEDAVVHEAINAVSEEDDTVVLPEVAVSHQAINAVSGEVDALHKETRNDHLDKVGIYLGGAIDENPMPRKVDSEASSSLSDFEDKLKESMESLTGSSAMIISSTQFKNTTNTVLNSQDCNGENYMESPKEHQISRIETSGNETDQLEFADGSIAKPLQEEKKVDYHSETETLENGAEGTLVEETMPSAVNTVPCVRNSSSLGDSTETLNMGDPSVVCLQSLKENDLDKQLKAMAVLLLNGSVDSISQTECVEGYFGPLSGNDCHAPKEEPQVSESTRTNLCENHYLNNTYTSEGTSFMTLMESSRGNGQQLDPEIQAILNLQESHVPSSPGRNKNEEFIGKEANGSPDKIQDFEIQPIQNLQESDVPSLQAVIHESEGRNKNDEFIRKELSWSPDKTRASEIQTTPNLQEFHVPSSEAVIHELQGRNKNEEFTGKETNGSPDKIVASEIQAIQNLQESRVPSLQADIHESQGRNKNEEFIRKETNGSPGKIRAPLKSFLLEPHFESRQEATAEGHPKSPIYVNDATSTAQASDGAERSIDKEWNSPARLPNNRTKRKVRWTQFFCCTAPGLHLQR